MRHSNGVRNTQKKNRQLNIEPPAGKIMKRTRQLHRGIQIRFITYSFANYTA